MTTMDSQVRTEHRWLDQLVGHWRYEGEGECEPGSAPERSEGTETVRSLGGLWVQAVGQGRMPDGNPAETVMTLGWDPERQRYIGTWIGSMMNYLWQYEGWIEDDGRRLVLESVGPSFAPEGGTATYRDIIEIRGPNERVLTGNVHGPDGQWHCFMTTTYRRTEAPKG